MAIPKKPTLATALQEASGKKPPVVVEAPQTAPTSDTTPISRQGKRAVAGHFDPAVQRQLRQLALDEDTSVQALLAEALNDLFVKYGKSPIAS